MAVAVATGKSQNMIRDRRHIKNVTHLIVELIERLIGTASDLNTIRVCSINKVPPLVNINGVQRAFFK